MISLNKIAFISLIALAVFYLNTIPAAADLKSPDAWGQAKSRTLAEAAGKECVQQELSTCVCDEDLGSIYYRKLVNYLFRKSKQIVDDFEGKHLINIHLQITEAQLRQLKEAESVRDIDAIVSTVIADSKNDFLQEAKEKLWSWFDQMHYFYLRIINSQIATLLFLAGLFLSSALIMRYLFKVNVIVSIILNVLLISLFFEYLECNRRLEFSNLEKLKSMNPTSNPCEASTKFFGLISDYDSKQCTEYMMSIHGHNRQFCLPSDVFSDFGLKLFFKPFSKFLDHVSEFVERTYEKYGIWKGIPIIIAILICLTYWMRSMLRVFVEGLFLCLTNRKTSHKPEAAKEAIGENKPAQVNVHINLDAKAMGDYIQTLRNDEEKSRAAITFTARAEGSPVKEIEDVSNGSEISSNNTSVDEEKKDK